MAWDTGLPEESEMIRLVNDFGDVDVTRHADPPVYIAVARLSETGTHTLAAYSIPELRAKMEAAWPRSGEGGRAVSGCSP